VLRGWVGWSAVVRVSYGGLVGGVWGGGRGRRTADPVCVCVCGLERGRARIGDAGWEGSWSDGWMVGWEWSSGWGCEDVHGELCGWGGEAWCVSIGDVVRVVGVQGPLARLSGDLTRLRFQMSARASQGYASR
jgi:hypothetical protein